MTTTDFLDPGRLWLLLVPLGLVVLYVVELRWRGRAAVRFPQVELLDEVAPQLRTSLDAKRVVAAVGDHPARTPDERKHPARAAQASGFGVLVNARFQFADARVGVAATEHRHDAVERAA